MSKQVLFVHGGGDGAFAADSKLAASLRKQLGSRFVVRYPQMPKESEPDYEAWKQHIVEELATMGDGALLVGHSIGASVLIKILAELDLKQRVAGVFLVASPFWHDDEVWHWKQAELPKNVADRLPPGMPVFLYHSRQDEVVPFSHLEMYAKALPHATIRAAEGCNHQMNENLTPVADDIKRLFARA